MKHSPTTLFRVLASAFLWLVLPLAMANAQGGLRLALVVGNSNYEAIYPLQNAVSDSRAVADALTGLGFEVTLLTDAGRAEMDAAIDAMAKRAADGAEATLFYFSGHGFQLAGANYIVPVDAVLDRRDVIEERTLRLDDIIARLDSESRQTLILLDACRNNPLPEDVRGADAGNGLADVRTGVNTFIAFATAPGGVATDGNGRHGPFAAALLENIDLPDMSISDMMTQVRASVRTKTANLQSPWDTNSLLAPFYFNAGTMEPLFAEIEDANLKLAGLPLVSDVPPTTVAIAEPTAPEVVEGREIAPFPPEVVADLPEPVAAPEPEPTVLPEPQQVALAEPVVAIPEPETPTTVPPVEAVDYAEAVQSELKRIGCYTRTVDGDWGANSRRALQRYYDSKDIASLGEEPTEKIHQLLVAESGRVCPVERVVVQAEPEVVRTPRVTVSEPEPEPAAPKPGFNAGGAGVFR